MDETPPPHRPWPTRIWEVFQAFLGLGLTAFGGPVAHLSYFRREFVERRAWLSDAAFADLLALAQFLPGPASSQLGMAIGLRRAGYLGLGAAWLGFTLPAGAAMIALAYASPYLTAAWGKGFLHGLQIAVVAVVLQALVAMARTLATGPVRAGIALGAMAGLIVAHGPVAQICALAAGGVFGLAFLSEPATDEPPDDPATHSISVPVSVAALGVFALLLVLLPVLAADLDDPTLGLASVFYRAGALVFGGGHVVLPLLEAGVVQPGWVSHDAFLAGYGMAQAVPGPLFSLAAYLGAIMRPEPNGLAGAALCLVGVFLPGLLLVVGALPFWDALRRRAPAQAAMRGANAAVVGVLAAALYDPVWVSAILGPRDFALALTAFLLLTVWRLPPWLVVTLTALGGAALAVG
jgi:chromate transporter